MRAAVASVTAAAFLLAGCSRAVKVPEEKLAPSSEWDGLHHVTTTTDRFTTRHFSVTDSTLIITRLSGSDERFGRVPLPITLPLRDVRSVERLENNNSATVLVVGGLLLVGVGIFITMALSGAFSEIE